jgi:DNA-3-methyladenine glycosylase I
VGETFKGADGRLRCAWCAATPEYVAYHDEDWGYPVDDDHRLFEKLCLEGFQSGLSWRTILSKRENFRAAFHDFDIDRIARYTARDVRRLLADAGIVRHRGKIEAVVNNAKCARQMIRDEGSLGAYFWRFAQLPEKGGARQAASMTGTSRALSKDLKARGWKFVGPTTVYAFMQAAGLVDDHAPRCFVRRHTMLARKAFTPPG